jgi:hypothetical protein
MGRPAIPLSDALLTATQASRLCRIPYTRWGRYWREHEQLVRGRRHVRAPGCKVGRAYWLRSYVVRHLHMEVPSNVGGAA